MRRASVRSALYVLLITAGISLISLSPSYALYDTPQHIKSFGSSGSGPGQFNVVAGIATNPATGEIYAADRHGARIEIFNTDGDYQGQFTAASGSGGAFFPVDIAINNAGTRIYVADFLNQTVRVFDETRVEIAQIGSPGTDPGEIDGYPIGLTLSSDGSKVVVYETGADPTYNHKVHVYNSNGTPFSDWETGTSGSGQYVHPAGLELSPDDSTLFVADSDNDNIQLFSLDGDPKSMPTIGSPGSGNGQFSQISGIKVSPDQSTLFVSDAENKRVQLFSMVNFNYIGQFATNGELAQSDPYSVGAITFSNDGSRLYIGDGSNRRISIFSLTISSNNNESGSGNDGSSNGSGVGGSTPKPPRTGALLGAGLLTMSILALIILVSQEIETKHLGKERTKNKFH